MSELLNKQVNAQKESLIKNFRGSHRLPQAHEKVCNENERSKKQRAPNGRKNFIRHMWKTDVMDIKQLQLNNS